MSANAGRSSSAGVIVAALVASVPVAHAADPVVTAIPPRREVHGLALSLGEGFSYSGVGLQARYDLPVWRSLIVSPFAAVGVLGALPGALGVTTMFGGRHRAAVDLGVAPLQAIHFYLHGSDVAERMVYGPMGGVGYEHMSDSGWLQRVTFEYGYAAWGSAVPIEPHNLWNLSLAFGRRLW
jgi:hypothetical protein